MENANSEQREGAKPTINILHVEDMAFYARYVKACAENSKAYAINVKHVSNLAEALDTVESHAWDVILADLWVGREPSFEFLQQVRKRLNRTPVVVLSGLDDARYRKVCAAAGAAAFVSKAELSPASLDETILKLMIKPDRMIFEQPHSH